MPGEGVRPTAAVCRGLLWLVAHIKWFTSFLRAFENSCRASALAADPEFLGDGRNTWTADTQLSYWCVNQISIEKKRTKGLGKIGRLSQSSLLPLLSPSFSKTVHECIKLILKQLFRGFCHHEKWFTTTYFIDFCISQQQLELGINLIIYVLCTVTHLGTV